jgi:hypothetical protein
MDPVHTNFDAEEFAKVKAVGRGGRTKMAGSFYPASLRQRTLAFTNTA